MKLLLAILLISLCFYGCCFQKCADRNVDSEFRIVSAADGKDLVFGSSKRYDSEKIRFYSLNGTDTVYLQSLVRSFNGGDYDSTIHVEFNPAHPVAYMKLSDGDVDTLAINFMTDKNGSLCCPGPFTKITSVEFNHSTPIPEDNWPLALKK